MPGAHAFFFFFFLDMMVSNFRAPRLLFQSFLVSVFPFGLLDILFFFLFGVTVLGYLGLAQVESLHFGAERIRVKLLLF